MPTFGSCKRRVGGGATACGAVLHQQHAGLREFAACTAANSGTGTCTAVRGPLSFEKPFKQYTVNQAFIVASSMYGVCVQSSAAFIQSSGT